MAEYLPYFGPETLLVPVPTATQRARQRGYDQADLLARELSEILGLPHQYLLSRLGQARQVGTGRKQRAAQLAKAFRVKGRVPINSHIMLVDDVVTTGATLEAAATILKKAGAKRVDAVIFAQTTL
jgi:ComF family protein